MTIISWGDINCFAKYKPIIWYYKKSLPAQNNFPGINSYYKILEKSHSYVYFFLITEN